MRQHSSVQQLGVWKFARVDNEPVSKMRSLGTSRMDCLGQRTPGSMTDVKPEVEGRQVGTRKLIEIEIEGNCYGWTCLSVYVCTGWEI